MFRSALVAFAACLLFLLLSSAASAADRFAEPGGDGAEPCAQSDPCDIQTAINDAAQYDDVTLLPGTYSSTVALGAKFDPSFDPKYNLTIHGSPGARPLVNLSGDNSATFYIGIGSSLRDVDVNSTVSNGAAVGGVEGGAIERVFAHSSGGDSAACNITGGSSIRDSVCWYNGPGGPNTSALSVGARYPDFSETDTARNVTAVATASYGIRVRSVTSINAGVTLAATNVFVRGGGGTGGEDVRTERLTGVPTTPIQAVSLDHSNYTSESEFASGDITDPGSGTNVTTAPAFANAANGDFHQVSTSTGTLNLGSATGMGAQELDLDGDFRAMGSAPDIGADEFGEAPPAPAITGSDPPSGSNENNPLLIGTAEPLSFVHVFASADCTGPEAGAEVAEEFASPGIGVAVPDDSTTTFTANAVNDTGTSDCSAPFTYTEVTTEPETNPPPPPPPAGGSPRQTITTKKKCKKKKKKHKRSAESAKKKCKKKKKH